MATAMDMGVEPDQGEEGTPQVQLDRFAGRTTVIVQGEDLSPTDIAGWTTPGRQLQQRAAMKQPATGESAAKAPKSTTSKAQFARRVNAALTRAARMPTNIPRGETKIIVRPRGGLNTGRIEAPVLMSAIMAATEIPKELAMEDTICANVAQNIIVVSTPDEQREARYLQLRALHIGGQVHEVSVYRAAPDNTVKGVIRNISTDDTEEEIKVNVVNPRNPTALEAHRIGNSTAVAILFSGTKVPPTIKYGAVLVRCSLYRQHYEICRLCGKVGHRTDVCPQPNARVCFACGKPNPGANHDGECKPHCKLCGGSHPTGSPGCSNRYKTPYLVKKRQRERKEMTSPRKSRIPGKDDASFPPLSQQRGRSRSHSRRRSASAGSARGRSASRRGSGRGNSRPSQSTSRSRERVAWADIVKAPAAQSRSKTPRNERERSTQRPDTMWSSVSREEFTALRAENAQLRQQLAEITRLLHAQQQQRQPPQPPQPPSLPRLQEPPPPPLPAPQQQKQPPPIFPKGGAQAPQPYQPASPQSPEANMSEGEEEVIADPRLRDVAPEPQPKRRAVEMARLRRTTERLDRLESRVTALEHRVDTRFATLENKVQAIQDTLVQIQTFLQSKFGKEEGTHDQTTQQLTPTWPGPQQQAQA